MDRKGIGKWSGPANDLFDGAGEDPGRRPMLPGYRVGMCRNPVTGFGPVDEETVTLRRVGLFKYFRPQIDQPILASGHDELRASSSNIANSGLDPLFATG